MKKDKTLLEKLRLKEKKSQEEELLRRKGVLVGQGYNVQKLKAEVNRQNLKKSFQKFIEPQRIKRAFNPQKFIPENITKEQGMLREIMGGQNKSWGTGTNLPQLNNALTSGGGLIKNDDNGETRRCFGFR